MVDDRQYIVSCSSCAKKHAIQIVQMIFFQYEIVWIDEKSHDRRFQFPPLASPFDLGWSWEAKPGRWRAARMTEFCSVNKVSVTTQISTRLWVIWSIKSSVFPFGPQIDWAFMTLREIMFGICFGIVCWKLISMRLLLSTPELVGLCWVEDLSHLVPNAIWVLILCIVDPPLDLLYGVNIFCLLIPNVVALFLIMSSKENRW